MNIGLAGVTISNLLTMRTSHIDLYLNAFSQKRREASGLLEEALYMRQQVKTLKGTMAIFSDKYDSEKEKLLIAEGLYSFIKKHPIPIEVQKTYKNFGTDEVLNDEDEEDDEEEDEETLSGTSFFGSSSEDEEDDEESDENEDDEDEDDEEDDEDSLFGPSDEDDEEGNLFSSGVDDMLSDLFEQEKKEKEKFNIFSTNYLSDRFGMTDDELETFVNQLKASLISLGADVEKEHKANFDFNLEHANNSLLLEMQVLQSTEKKLKAILRMLRSVEDSNSFLIQVLFSNAKVEKLFLGIPELEAIVEEFKDPYSTDPVWSILGLTVDQFVQVSDLYLSLISEEQKEESLPKEDVALIRNIIKLCDEPVSGENYTKLDYIIMKLSIVVGNIENKPVKLLNIPIANVPFTLGYYFSSTVNVIEDKINSILLHPDLNNKSEELDFYIQETNSAIDKLNMLVDGSEDTSVTDDDFILFSIYKTELVLNKGLKIAPQDNQEIHIRTHGKIPSGFEKLDRLEVMDFLVMMYMRGLLLSDKAEANNYEDKEQEKELNKSRNQMLLNTFFQWKNWRTMRSDVSYKQLSKVLGLGEISEIPLNDFDDFVALNQKLVSLGFVPLATEKYISDKILSESEILKQSNASDYKKCVSNLELLQKDLYSKRYFLEPNLPQALA